MSKIPNADIVLPKVTLGTMTFGSPVVWEDAVELTRYAISRGINHIDTANMYEGYNRYAGSAGGVAEEIVGEAIKVLPRNDVIISTKLGMKVGDKPEDEGTSPAAIRKQLDASLIRLNTDYIDIYYLHRPDESCPVEDILEAMKAEIDAGKVRYYGVSNYSAEQLENLIRVADKNNLPRPVICQPPLSLLKQDALDKLIPLCAKENIAVIPYQIYQGGLLTGKYHRGMELPSESRAAEKPEWMMKMDDEFYDKLEIFEKAAKEAGMSMAEYALNWAMNQPAVVSVLVGIKRKEQLEAAIVASEK